MIKFYRKYQLICDECGIKSDIGHLEDFIDQWYLDQFWYDPGYAFYRMSCSKQCQQAAHARFVNEYFISKITDVVLTELEHWVLPLTSSEPIPIAPPPDDVLAWRRKPNNG